MKTSMAVNAMLSTLLKKYEKIQKSGMNVSTGGYAAYSLAYDLGKLSHLEKYGVDLSRI